MRELKKTGLVSRMEVPTSHPSRYRRMYPSVQENDRAPHPSVQHKDNPIPSTELSRQSQTELAKEVKSPDLSLGDIPDFSLRMKVAQLMAVAPSLPVQDLYDLLMEMKGHYENARDQVFERTRTRTLGRSVPPQSACSNNVIQRGNEDEEDTKVKIDLNDPDIYNDNDVPSRSPTPEPAPRKSRSKATSKRLANSVTKPKTKSKVPSTGKAKSHTKSLTRKATQPKQVKANVGAKRSKPSSRTRRSNSIDGVFVISDDESDLDGSYRDIGSVRNADDAGNGSDIEMVNADAELFIDMEDSPYHRRLYTPLLLTIS